jgi:hypothetical protein
MNVKLLRRIQKHILAEPKRLDMGNFIVRKSDGLGSLVRFPKCGTVGCIAGWAVTLSTASGSPLSGDAADESACTNYGGAHRPFCED